MRQRRSSSAAPRARIAAGQPWERPARDEDIDLALYHLLTGFDHFGEGLEAGARDLWEVVREPFLAEHVRRRPGTRPWAWWELDAPEPRKMLEGGPDRISPSAVMWMGAPSAHACRFEGEAYYLTRTKLALGGELGGEYDFGLAELDDATEYARQITDGRLPACKAIRWACQRHLDDLETGWRQGFFWDRRALHYRMSFSRYIRHYQGLRPGTVYEPEPWQWFRTGSMFAWMKADGRRRFRSSVTFLTRGSGKTFMAAEDMLFGLIADGEEGAEIFCGATKREQAAKAIRDAIGIRSKSPLIKSRTLSSGIHVRGPKEIHHPESAGFLKTMTAESAGEQGHNVHFGILDELAQYRDGGMAEALVGGMGKRVQPLSIAITTAGPDSEGFGYREYEHARDILNPDSDVSAPHTFAYIAELDDREAWADEGRWPEYMPNLGVSHTLEDMRAKVEKAKDRPDLLNDHLIYRCNVWAEAAETWLPWDISRSDGTRGGWKWCAEPGINGLVWRRDKLRKLAGERVVLGLDISSKIDLSALVAVFVDTDPLVIVPWYWMPREPMIRAESRDRVPYGMWAGQGWLVATPGEQIDQAAIQAQIEDIAAAYVLLDVAVDPWNAAELSKTLKDAGVEMVDCVQRPSVLTEPSKMLEALVASNGIDHGHNPILAWNARNAVAKRDAAGGLRPDKSRVTRKRIDGISALVNALWRKIHYEDTDVGEYVSFIGAEE